jgi:PKD repeat protein
LSKRPKKEILMRLSCCLWIVIFWAFNCQAQKETNKWYFGNKAALDFSSGSPVSIANSSMVAIEGCSSAADAQGNLLFYTNGMEVFNKNHQYLDNSNNPFLLGHTSSTQSSLIVKKPGAGSIYYLFTTGAAGIGPLAYSIIDMSLAAGMGSVTVKNTTLAAGMTEKLNATLHCNGSDVWIVAHKYNSDEFYSYLLSATGVNPVPIVSGIGSSHTSIGTGTISFAGYMKISPTGKKLGLIITSHQNNVELFDFDNLTGTVSNSLTLGANNVGYGCEFSADGSKFFTSEYTSSTGPAIIRQWDLCAGTNSAIVASQQTVSSGINVYNISMQLSAGGKIVVAEYGKPSLGLINNPDLAGSSMNYVPQAISLSTGSCTQGLPNLIGSHFKKKSGATFTLNCSTVYFSNQVPGCAASGYSVNSTEWNFGDPSSASSNTSTLQNPSHMFSANGTYTVTLLNRYNCFTDTIKQVINLSSLPNLQVNGSMSLCAGSSKTYSISGADSYLWSTGQTTSTVILTPSTTSVYSVTGTSTASGCSATKIFTVTVKNCTGLEEHVLSGAELYPNPFESGFTVDVDKPVSLEFFEVTGKIIYSATLQPGRSEIELTSAPAGLYCLRFVAEGKEKIIRIIKN